jgi:hypothetical protein
VSFSTHPRPDSPFRVQPNIWDSLPERRADTTEAEVVEALTG